MKLSMVTGGIWRRGSKMTDIETIKELAEIGYRTFDYTLPGDEIGFENTVYMSDGWKDYAESLAAFMEENGYTFGQAHIPLSSVFGNPLASTDEALLMAGYCRSFEAASILKVPYMVYHPGAVVGNTKEEFLEKNKAFLLRLIDKVAKYGVKIAVENIGVPPEPYYVRDGKELREFVEYINHPLVGACWDVGHANLNRADQYESITALGEHLWCLHVHDNVGGFEPGFKRWRQDLHTAPLMTVSGVNFDAVLQALIDIDYKGTFNLEVEDPRPVWKLPFMKNGVEQESKLFYATDSMRKIARKAGYEIAKEMLSAYGIECE